MLKPSGLLVFLGLFALLGINSCKNPLVGLGPRVDLNPPDGSTTGIKNGDYVSGDITLTGTIEDDKEVASVSADINGESVPGVIDVDGNWTIDVDTSDPIYGGDGEKDITIYLVDATGKITEKQMLLFFDNSAPVLMVTVPDLTSPQNTSTIVIRGEAYDPFRLKEVRASVGQGSFTIGTNTGTPDSWLFSLSHGVSGSELFGVVIEAVDMAGNVSQAVFHSKDLRYLNNAEPITVIDLYQLVDGTDLGLVITPTDVIETTIHTGLPSGSSSTHLTFGAGIDGLPLDIDMSGDIPQINVTTPNPNIPAPGDTMGPSSKVNGTVTDNVEVDETSLEIRFFDEFGAALPFPNDDWKTIVVLPAQIINDQNVNFSYTLPGLADGDYRVQVRAQDNNGSEGTTPQISFRIDGNAPVVEITSPALSAYIADSSVVIEGTAHDSEPILVEISLDNGANWRPVATVVDSGVDPLWSYTISDWEDDPALADFNDFTTIPVRVRATSPLVAGTTTFTNHSLILDRKLPVVEFLTPPDSRNEFGVITGDVNGVVTLRVAVSDDSLNSVSYKIGINGPVEAVSSGSLYNWSKTVVTPLMEDPNLATQISPGIWELPVTVTAVDKAGNTTVTSDYTMIIDNSRDRPNLSVIYPIEGQSYGGEVTVSGIATDDDGSVAAVFVQVDLDTPPGGTPNFTGTHTLTDGIDFDGTGAITNINEATAYQVSGRSSWFFPLNTTGELYDIDGAGPHDGDIHVRVWAVDPINILVTSIPKTIKFRLDDTLPRVDQILINTVPAASNTYVTGIVDLDVTVSDDAQINKLEISYDNGVTLHNRNLIPAQSFVETFLIDTSVKVSGGNGILYLRIKATDNTGYTVLEVLPLNVDNNPPQGTYPGAEPIMLNGTGTFLQGTASDPIGSIAGVNRIEVYLERLGKLYNPLAVYPYTNPATPNINTETTTFGAGNYYPVNPSGPGVMVIDDVNELGSDTVSGDGDGFDESLTLVGSTWNWWVKFNSKNIPDGDITIHFVVVDQAGNKTHYSKSARIENKPPVIESIVLGTDINYNTAINTTVGAGEAFRYVDGTGVNGGGVFYVDFDTVFSTITSRNHRLLINADASATDGNGAPGVWLWELYYKGGGANLLGTGVDSITITNFSIPVVMPDEDDVSYILRVTDDAGLSDEVELLISLDNTDTVNPEVTFSPLDLNHSIPILARGGAGNFGYAVPGYNPAEIPLWGSAEGRLRPSGAGVYNGLDADVSGKVIISGYAEDDKTIHKVDLTITGYNGGLGAGNPFTILDWNPAANGGLGGLKVASGVVGTPFISSESYGESSGHVVYWSFEFDTSSITGGAQANMRVSAVATDKSSRINTPINDVTADNYTTDVMPFIMNVVTSNAAYTADSDIIRSRYGAWPVREASYLKISGFNLGSTVGLKPSMPGNPLLPNLGAAYTVFAGVSVSADKKEVRAQALGIVNSGWLAMETSSVPLMNYYGDFIENDSTDPTWTNDALWTDDRYLSVWDVTGVMAGSADAVWGAMAGSRSNGSLWGSWSEYSSARVLLSNEGTQYNDDVADAGVFRIYDPSEYTDVALNNDGTPYVVHLANFYGGTGDWATGSGGLVLWGDRADTWRNTNLPQLPYGNTVNGIRAEEIERFSQDQRLWQFQNPRIAATGPNLSTDIHVSYYDNYSKALKYAHFRDNGTSIFNITFNTTLNAATNNKQYIYANPAQFDQNIVAGDAGYPGGPGDNGSDMGSFSDIAVDTAGRPVIVYYDTINATLRLTRATTTSPINHVSGADWVDQSVAAAFSYVGRYPSVRIDPTGRVHVTAYKISTGDLMYYSAPDPGAGSAYVFGAATVVDGDGNMGAYADLDLFHDPVDGTYNNGDDIYKPVVGYLDSSNVGTFAGLKYAFRRNDGAWEHGTVPLLNAVDGKNISAAGRAANLGTVNYSMALGFHSGSYRYARLRLE